MYSQGAPIPEEQARDHDGMLDAGEQAGDQGHEDDCVLDVGRQESQLEPHAEPPTLPVVGNIQTHNYGPMRHPSRTERRPEGMRRSDMSLTNAMRRDLNLLDHGGPIRGTRADEEADQAESAVNISEDAFIVHLKKKGRKEVLERGLSEVCPSNLDQARQRNGRK